MPDQKAGLQSKLVYGTLSTHFSASIFFSGDYSNEVLLLQFSLQSTLVISKSKGLSETLRYIRTSTYQICGTEEKNINRTTTFNKMNM